MLSDSSAPRAQRYTPARVVNGSAMHYYRSDAQSPGIEYVRPIADAAREAVAARAANENSPARKGATARAGAGYAEELALITAVRDGDRQAFERLYYLYAPRLARYLQKFLRSTQAVEEAINDVMLVVWQSAARYDANASRLSTWMFGIAHNKALKSLSRSGRHAAEISYDVDDAREISDESFASDAFAQPALNHPERELLGKQFGAALAWALDQLSAEHRGVIELAFAEECSYEEIGAIMQCPTNTVKTRVFHARKKLAQLLASRGVDYGADIRG